jgi:CHAD domain-containing protein
MPPEALGRLYRLRAVSAYRAGRANSAGVRLVWHDTADGALARRGLSLCEQRGRWRLEKLHPAEGDGWLPAAPPPLLAEAADAEALDAACAALPMPGPLAASAVFAGRQRILPLAYGGQAVTLHVLAGTLRGVLEDRPVCRVTFLGEARAVAGLAAALAEDVALRVPVASLTAEALCVAKGGSPMPRRLGAPSVPAGASVAEALEVITAHLADVILYWGSEVCGAATEEPVHQMRVGVRRLRSALSVFRRVVPGERAWLDDLGGELKSLAGLLGAARDWDVFLATTGAEVQQALGGDRRVAAMVSAASRRRLAAYDDLRAFFASGGGWRGLSLRLALLPRLRPWENDASGQPSVPVAAYAPGALGRRLRHVLAAGETLEGLPTAHLHDIRKQAKRLRYAIEFFTPLFPHKAVRKYLARLEALQEGFGTLNDMAVAGALADGLGGAFAAGAVQGFGAARAQRATRKLQRGWAKFCREAPFWE